MIGKIYFFWKPLLFLLFFCIKQFITCAVISLLLLFFLLQPNDEPAAPSTGETELKEFRPNRRNPWRLIGNILAKRNMMNGISEYSNYKVLKLIHFIYIYENLWIRLYYSWPEHFEAVFWIIDGYLLKSLCSRHFISGLSSNAFSDILEMC